jgi:lipopolysaccharide/colanic/teichoic acid biosynthesis glycosyltransferase
MSNRVFDVVGSGLLLWSLSPVLVATSIAIKLDSRGPVFHRATRVGKDGKPFGLYKFRTMVPDAARRGPGITRADDPRITRTGRILRHFKLDEMPQLVNVLKGDMSLVGPRPEDPRFVAHYTPEQCAVLRVRPGIAGPAAVQYRHEEQLLAGAGDQVEQVYLAAIMPEKLRLDLEYLERQSILGDVRVLAQAVMAVLGRG